MPFLKLFNFEPTVVTERTFASLSNLHIKKKKPRQKQGGLRKKNTQISKAFQCLDYTKPILACFNKMTVL